MIKQTLHFLAGAALAASVLAPLGARAQPQAGSVPSHAEHAASMTDGEIRKIDKEAGKVTIRHGEIGHLQMPGMTMVFTAKDPALLDSVKPGDKVRFMVVREDGKMVVTDIQPAP